MREDAYKINDADPLGAYHTDIKHLNESDIVLALLEESISPGVQTEIGYAIAKGKKVFLAHHKDTKLTWFNQTLVQTGVAQELIYPLDISKIK